MKVINKKLPYNSEEFMGKEFNSTTTIRQLGHLFNSSVATIMRADRMFNILFSQLQKTEEARCVNSFSSGYEYKSNFQSKQIRSLIKKLAPPGVYPYFQPVPEFVERFEQWQKVTETKLSVDDHVTHLQIKGIGRADHDIDAPRVINYFHETVFTHMVLAEERDNIHIVECWQVVHKRDEEIIVKIL